MVDAAGVMTIPSAWLAFAESPFQDGFAHIPWTGFIREGIVALAMLYPLTLPILVKPPSLRGAHVLYQV